MNSFSCAWRKISEIIAGSEVPEDLRHAENTIEWLVRLRPNAGLALLLAALGHDIDRATPDRIRRESFDDYDAFKAAHAERSAALLAEIFSECGVEEAIASEACRLVRLHEVGGDPDADLLRDADSLSYFDVNLPLYYQREGYGESLRRCVWGLRRITSVSRQHLTELHQGTELQKLIKDALRIVAQEFERDREPARYQNA
ncbi:MAG: DUF4202 family protein [Candidatus Sedimenticola endophacoides]